MDLGINTDAVCTIMRSDGTVLGRKFINFPSEKDRMYRVLGRIRRFQREHSSVQAGGRWEYASRLNAELARKIAEAVSAYAEEHHSDVIVFEYLERQGKIAGNKKQKLHLWRKRISRNAVSIRHTGKGCVYPGSVRGIPAGWHMTGPGQSCVMGRTIACVPFRQEKDITVISQLLIISERDILSVNF